MTLPNGDKLEAHSGLGEIMDDPRHVNVRMRGATPPGTYALTEREQPFHGVRAIRLTPVGGPEAVYGRVGLLAHTFMLGPTGASNGCVSFRDYSRFLDSYLRGEIRQLVVVAGSGGARRTSPRPARCGWRATERAQSDRLSRNSVTASRSAAPPGLRRASTKVVEGERPLPPPAAPTPPASRKARAELWAKPSPPAAPVQQVGVVEFGHQGEQALDPRRLPIARREVAPPPEGRKADLPHGGEAGRRLRARPADAVAQGRPPAMGDGGGGPPGDLAAPEGADLFRAPRPTGPHRPPARRRRRSDRGRRSPRDGR